MNKLGFARLIDAETGIPMTRAVKASKICRKEETIYELLFTADQKPAILCEKSSIAVRQAPLDDQAFQERLENMSRYVVPPGSMGPKQLSDIRALELPETTKPSAVPKSETSETHAKPDISAKKVTLGNP